MCTVSIVTWANGLRLAANRDERRGRAPAHPPRLVERDGVRVLMPIDPASNGTWVAANELGVAFALLNVNPAIPFTPGARSRGGIVAALAPLGSIDDVAEAMAGLDPAPYSPFRLIAAAGCEAIEIAPSLSLTRRHALEAPVVFTSSGLGDALVEGPRRTLFAEMVGRKTGHARTRDDAENLIARQDAFHAHRWRELPHLSVRMSRNDACTVSKTVIEIGERRIVMTYAGEPGWEASSMALPRARPD